jgi:hypothetical protein
MRFRGRCSAEPAIHLQRGHEQLYAEPLALLRQRQGICPAVISGAIIRAQDDAISISRALDAVREPSGNEATLTISSASFWISHRRRFFSPQQIRLRAFAPRVESRHPIPKLDASALYKSRAVSLPRGYVRRHLLKRTLPQDGEYKVGKISYQELQLADLVLLGPAAGEVLLRREEKINH